VTCEPLTSSAARAAAEARESVSLLSVGAVSWRFIPGRDAVVVGVVAECGELILPSPPRPVPALKRAGAPEKRGGGQR
jgi:hypothetical protein